MTGEQEAQQAQTIAEIEAVRDDGDYHRSYYRATVDKALSLIYSQAQKIAEQAKRIAELEKDAAEHVCCLANNGW